MHTVRLKIAEAEREDLPVLLVGGNAVILWGVPRFALTGLSLGAEDFVGRRPERDGMAPTPLPEKHDDPEERLARKSLERFSYWLSRRAD